MILIEVPRNLKPLADAVSNLVNKVTAAVKRNAGGRGGSYEKVEAEFEQATAEVERAAHAVMLASLDVDVPAITVGGSIYTRFGRYEGTYYTLAGEVQVPRTVYRKTGVRNGELLDPIAVRAGAFPTGWLPKTCREIAFLMQQGTEREAEQDAKELGRLPYSASTFKRVAHLYGQAYRERRADIEDQLIEEFQIPAGAVAVSISIDRTSVPMEEPRKRPPGRPRKNAPKRLVTRQFRMAWCGTLTIHDSEGESVETIRYGAMPGADPNILCGRMAVDAHKLLEKRGHLNVVLLADGAHELWTLLEEHFPESVFGKTIRLVDFWHLIEKLSAAAKVIHGTDASRMAVDRWKSRLRRAAHAIEEIRVELEASGMDTTEVDGSCPVREAITYLNNHRERMNYAPVRKAGLPIGSGNVEATCKSLFALRMKRSGSRWHEDTGENIVQLRALALSDRWDAAMSRFLAERGTAVRIAG
jgi:hypothetical protein